jgi:hypothetical protein
MTIDATTSKLKARGFNHDGRGLAWELERVVSKGNNRVMTTFVKRGKTELGLVERLLEREGSITFGHHNLLNTEDATAMGCKVVSRTNIVQ